MRVLVKCFEEDVLSNLWIPYVHSFDVIVYLASKEVAPHKITFINKIISDKNQIKILVTCLHQVSDTAVWGTLKEFLGEEIYIQVTEPTRLSCRLIEFAINNKLPRVLVDKDAGKIISIYKAELLEQVERPLLFSLETMISLKGAKLIKSNRSMADLENQSFQKDIIGVFNIIKKAHRQWSSWMQLFTKELKLQGHKKTGVKLSPQLNASPILKKLREANILLVKDNVAWFKSDEIEKLFKDIGIWLEYYVYIQLDKTNQFNDIIVGGLIDYDGNQGVNCDPTCEIDILCIKKYKNAFISCKMNKVDAEALNEIKLHTLMFGNEKTKAILVTCANLSNDNPLIFRKAQELGVSIVEQKAVLSGTVAASILKILDQ